MIVVGTDPGTSSTGWARVTVEGGGRLPVVVTYVDAGNVESKPSTLAPLLRGADIVGVECLEGIAYPQRNAGIVTHLIASAEVAGIILGIACARGMRTMRMPAKTWRGLVCRKPNASDAVVKNVVLRIVRGLPKTTNVHQRDALGVALGVAWSLGGDVGLQRQMFGKGAA